MSKGYADDPQPMRLLHFCYSSLHCHKSLSPDNVLRNLCPIACIRASRSALNGPREQRRHVHSWVMKCAVFIHALNFLTQAPGPDPMRKFSGYVSPRLCEVHRFFHPGRVQKIVGLKQDF